MSVVLDACALIALLRGEAGSEIVAQNLIEGNCFAHAVNLCEVYYDCIRVDGEDKAEALVRDLMDAGVTGRTDIDEDFWKEVGRIKAGIARISLADCFAIALARRLNVPVLTSDHHEFDNIAAHGICAVEFIR
jgi:PIN domain nuclease of toxin-antitoxin system